MLLLCLCVDGGDVAKAAFETAHLEENALLWARRELAPCSALQLLGQAEAWNRCDAVQYVQIFFFLLKIIQLTLAILACKALGRSVMGYTASPAEPVLLVDMWKPLC